MEIREELEKTRQLLIQQVQGKSISQKKRYAYEYLSFNDLSSLCDCKYMKLPYLPLPKEGILLEDIELYYRELEDVADHAIEAFKNANFYSYWRKAAYNLPKKEQEEILSSFFSYFMPELNDIYHNLTENNHIFNFSEEDQVGMSFLLPNVNHYYLGLNIHDLKNDSFYLLATIIHELMHIYSAKFLRNYSPVHHRTIINHLCTEAITYYAELSFYHFCKKNYIHPEMCDFLRNRDDQTILYFYKALKYFYMKLKDSNASIYSDGVTYEIEGDLKLEYDKGLYMFSYKGSTFKSGSLTDFIVATSYLFSLELLECERTGANIKKTVNTFLLEVDEDTFLETYQRGFNYKLLENELINHQEYLKKNYPLPGYDIRKK